MITFTSLLRRVPSLSHKEFVTYHRQHHAPLFSGTPEAQRYVLRYAIDHPRTTFTPGLPSTTFDAVVRMQFGRYRDLVAMFSSASYWKVIRPDEKRFFDFRTSEFLLSQERVLIGPDAWGPGAAPADPFEGAVPLRISTSEDQGEPS